MALPTTNLEYPKRLTATNAVTGALIKSRGTNQDVYADGWDRIFGKKDDKVWLECSCGKYEIVSISAYENGDTGWYSDDIESGKGLCCGQFCMP